MRVGISFYTFQSMGHAIDVYRREMETQNGLLTFISALSFFPQLLAEPTFWRRFMAMTKVPYKNNAFNFLVSC